MLACRAVAVVATRSDFFDLDYTFTMQIYAP